jgi:hypothetical protein
MYIYNDTTQILSIDVGIRNLSFCLFEVTSSEISIIKWNNINLGDTNELKCDYKNNDDICNKISKYKTKDSSYCLKHAKLLNNYLLPQKELKETFLKKQKLINLYNICNKYNIKYESKHKKIDLINLLLEIKCLSEITKSNSNKIDLVTIGKNIQYKLDNELNNYVSSINKIIIENQIGPIANKMKTIQGMISQYFIMKNNNISIDFISATNKLKHFINDNISYTYKDRKKKGIEICSNFVNSDKRFNEWKDYFNNSKKKDDLSDCFLQGLWFINKTINI